MSEISLESKLNSKELNKILPSYLIDEVEDDNIVKEEKQKKISKEKNKVSNYIIIFNIYRIFILL